MASGLTAGASAIDITPKSRQFLFGYPHVERYSTGVHDPLLGSALCFSDGKTSVIFVANDIIFIPKDLAGRARERIQAACGVPAANILLSATHTHSGPITVDYISNEADPVVPSVDPAYLEFMEDRIVTAATEACRSAQPAEIGLAVADGSCTGTNRRDPNGPSDPQVPVLAVRQQADGRPVALMLVCSMHPTVLHEDSTLISGDFPGMTRQFLQQHVAGQNCPILHHTGPAGNQSPRRVVKANTFAEAERLGHALGQTVAKALGEVEYASNLNILARQSFVDLPRRSFPTVDEAAKKLAVAVEHLEALRSSGAPHVEVRTAECDWFGAEETLTLAKAAADGRLDAAAAACLPAEIQVFKIGPWSFVGWQGEIFVEYGLAVKAEHANAFVISTANGEFQGYIVPPESAAEGGYEASNALFATESGRILVDRTVQMLTDMRE